MSLSPGAEVGAYEVEGLLGSGGMASVYRVRHRVLGSSHALKVLHPQLVRDETLRGRFLEEGRVQAQLRHPGLVRVTDLVSEPGVAGLVMDFLEGETLGERVRKGALSVEEAVGILLEALCAVEFAHERGIIHRDLKPGNLFLERDGPTTVVKVLDFGIAKVADKQRTVSSQTMGTIAYMSPEQLQDPASVDLRTDIFAFGAVLYEMVTGQTAFDGTTEFATMQKVVASSYTPLSARVTNAPPALTSAIERALAANKAERFPSCAAFARALFPLAEDADRRSAETWAGTEDAVPETVADSGMAVMPEAPASVTWQEQETGEAPPTVALERDEARALVEEPQTAPQLPVLEPEVITDIALRESDGLDTATRIAGGIQLGSGIINVFFMWMVSCSGLSSVTVGLARLLGVPGWISWMGNLVGVMGCVLVMVGLLEMTSGTLALLQGRRSYRLARLTAFVELASLPMGGLFSAVAGVVNLVMLFVARRSER